MLFDTHMHCDYSIDAHMKFAEAVAAAKQQGIGMTVTEHWDRDYPTDPKAFIFDVDEYFTKFLPYRSDIVLQGIELGMQEHTAAADQKLLTAYDFDCVIASMHCVHGRDIYAPEAYAGLTKAEAVTEYLEASLVCLELYQDFDTLGHIDYISRYMPYEDQELYYAANPELWDELFRVLIKGGRALEINTRRLAEPQAAAALKVLYQRFAQLGGKYVTLGSDAHYVEHIGRGLAAAYSLAAACELTPVYFQQRKMMKLEK